MDENRFFKFVWRFNGLVIMAGVIIGIIALLFAGIIELNRFMRSRSRSDIAGIGEVSPTGKPLRFGALTSIPGTPHSLIPLVTAGSFKKAYYGRYNPVYNYLFLDRETEEMAWLLPSNEYLILSDSFLHQGGQEEEERNTLAVLYFIVKKDTNSDNVLDGDDEITIALSGIDGKGYKEIVEGVDIFLGHHIADENTLIIAYNKQGKGYYAKVHLEDFHVTSTKELPRVTGTP